MGTLIALVDLAAALVRASLPIGLSASSCSLDIGGIGARPDRSCGSVVRILEDGFATFVERPDAFDPVGVDS